MNNQRTTSSLVSEKFFDNESEQFLVNLKNSFADGRLSGTASPVLAYGDELKQWFGTDYALPVASGSSAIFLALYALGVKPGDHVIVSALAPVPTLLPILHLGAHPLFVDVELGTFKFDPADLKKALLCQPKAALAVALWGYPVLTNEIIDLFDSHSIPLIEDSAHAHGTVELERLSGSVGKIGCFSTHDNKLLSTGEGGFVLTDSFELYEQMVSYSHLGHCTGQQMGFNFKLSTPQALLGRDRLIRLHKQLALRKLLAMELLELIKISDRLSQIMYEPSSALIITILVFI